MMMAMIISPMSTPLFLKNVSWSWLRQHVMAKSRIPREHEHSWCRVQIGIVCEVASRDDARPRG